MSFPKRPKRRSPLRKPARPARTAQQPNHAQPDPGERLQKFLAQAGLGSRRRLEALIAEGRIRVNGRPAVLGQRVSAADHIVLDGRDISIDSRERTPRLLLYHKRAGEIVSRADPGGRPSVFERLPEVRGARWIAVGRLDFNTSGLLLFTDSGQLAHRLMHPSFGMKREYAARVVGVLSEPQKTMLLRGVKLEDGMARFDAVEEAGGKGTNKWYRVMLHEGRNREVRRLFEALGMTVSRLMRVSFGPVQLPRNLRQGQYRELPPSEVRELMRHQGD